MLMTDQKTGLPVRTDGGYSNGLLIKDTYVQIGGAMRHMHCVLYEPVKFMEESRIGIIIIHSDEDYSSFPIGPELAKRGFRTLCGQVTDPAAVFDEKIKDIGRAVRFLKNYEGIHKVILMGHSGGATLMSAYESIAENGPGIYQTEQQLYRCTITEQLTPADGIMLLDSNWGNGSMTLLSVDPAVTEEGNGIKLDPELDLLNEKNGYTPEGCYYSEAFIRKYCRAQAERNNRIVEKAVERLHLIEAGKGDFLDDEPFIVAGGAQFAPCNKLIPQDNRLLSHTRNPYMLLHADGSGTEEIIRCLRRRRGAENMTAGLGACLIGTVKGYLSNRAVRASREYQIKEDEIAGIEWKDTYNCTPGNMQHVHIPALIMGMTGSYEYLASEVIYENTGAKNKEVYFSEASGHNFFLQEGIETFPGQYGDPARTVFDKAACWMSNHFI